MIRVLLASGWGLALGAVANYSLLHFADSLHGDEQANLLKGGLLALAYCFGLAAGLRMTRKEPEEDRRTLLTICVVVGSLPGVGLGALMLLISSIFTKGVA